MTLFDKIFSAWEKRRNDAKRQYWYGQKSKFARDYVASHRLSDLTSTEKEKIDTYWAQYGIRFRDYSWFQCFRDIRSEEVNPHYIPNEVYAYIIWPYYDNPYYVAPWKDKNFFERFLPNMPFPEVRMRCINGRYEDSVGTYLDFNKAIKLFNYPEQVIVKDAWDSGEGRGVKKYNLQSEIDVKGMLDDWNDSKNFLIQKVISQHPILAQFNESSVNILRISSWRHNDQVEILAPTIRFGVPGYVTDTCYIEGVETGRVVGVNLEGTVKDTIVSYDGTKSFTKSLIPNVSEIRIPRFKEILDLIRQAHRSLQLFDIVGWDITVTDKGEIVCIEYNIKRPGTVFYQFVNGPFFGEHTDEVLSFLKDKQNQNKYIPKWLKNNGKEIQERIYCRNL